MDYLINALLDLDGEDLLAGSSIILFTLVLLLYSAVVSGVL